jgi:hypothetical protein
MKTTIVFALPILLLAPSAVHASILVEVSQVGGLTQFTISGNVNPLALTYRAGPFPGGATGVPAINSANPLLGFGGNEDLRLNLTIYNLPNLVGPAAFGTTTFDVYPEQSTGTNFISLALKVGDSISLDQYTAKGATLDDTMAFETYAALGLRPGTYIWSWSNGSASDSLTLQINPVPEPAIFSLLLLGGISSGWLLKRQKV